MKTKLNDAISLKVALDVEDGWPPVAVESLPFRVMATKTASEILKKQGSSLGISQVAPWPKR